MLLHEVGGLLRRKHYGLPVDLLTKPILHQAVQTSRDGSPGQSPYTPANGCGETQRDKAAESCASYRRGKHDETLCHPD